MEHNEGPEPFQSYVVEGLPNTPSNLAWLQAHFECEQCGRCCQVHTVGVRIRRPEAERLARKLGVSTEEFLKTVLEAGETYIIPQPCPYLADSRCMVHDVKPAVCRSYPFNKHQQVNRDTAWIVIAGCPGGQKLARLLGGGKQLGLEYRPFRKK
jgi:Fe-S-cluster containining protein